MAAELEPYEQAVLAVVRDVFGELICHGEATLDVRPLPGAYGGWLFEVKPRRREACPITVYAEDQIWVQLEVGRHALTAHVADKDPAKLERRLGEFLGAIAEGAYYEEVRLAEDGDTGKGRGTIRIGGREHTFTYSNVATIGLRGPWQRIEYAPYRDTDE